MTVESFTPSPTYTVAGIGPYAIQHPYRAGTIRVLVTTGAAQQELLGSDYSVTPGESDVAGSVFLTPTAAALHAGKKLAIVRVTDLEQGWVGVLGERERGLEAQLDVTVQAVQELRDLSSRSLRLRDPIAPFVPEAGRLLLFDGAAIVPGPLASEVVPLPPATGIAPPFPVPQLFSYGVKDTARNRAEALAMSADLSAMRGYAAHAGVTGGGSGTAFWVENDSSDETEPGSLTFAIAAAVASAAPSRILVDPGPQFRVVPREQFILPANCTFDAPGRNLTIVRSTNTTAFKITGVNTVLRRVRFEGLYVEGGSKRDAIWVDIATADRFWIDQCSMGDRGDACIDIVSLADAPNPVRGTVSRCLFRNHDKTALVGSLACYQDSLTTAIPSYCATATPANVNVSVTWYANLFECAGERNPKVFSRAFVHSVNNAHVMAQYRRDEGGLGACYGVLSATGGAVWSERDLFISAEGTGWEGVNAVTTTFAPRVGGTIATEGPGFAKVTGSVAADGITLTERQAASVPVPPYSLTAVTVTDTPAGRAAFLAAIRAQAGAEADAAPPGAWVYDAASTRYPDFKTSISVAAAGPGRWLRTTALPAMPFLTRLDQTTIYVERGGTLTIAGGAITLPPNENYFAVETEGGAATDDLVTINGGTNGRRLYLRSASSSRDVVVRSTGNIGVVSDYTMDTNLRTLTLIYDSGLNRWQEVSRV